MTEPGHNGGPPIQKLTAKRKVKRIQEVLDMDISAAQKCIGIRIIADADTDGVTPELSTKDLKRAASVKDCVTVYRATQRLDERKVAKAVKEDGRPNRYLVLPSEAIDAALDEIDATSAVQPHGAGAVGPQGEMRSNPTGPHPQPVRLNRTTQCDQTPPVGLEHTGSDRTGGVEPHGFQPDPSRARANIENPTGLLSNEEDKNKQIPISPEKPKRATPRPKPTLEQFDRFWEAYPKRDGKQKALQRFMDLTPADAEKAVAAAKQFAAQCKRDNVESRYIKWAEGWLNAKRFLDYEAPKTTTNGQPPPNWWRANPEAARKLASETFWREAIKCANGHWPVEYLGPPPTDPDCLLPPNLRTEMAKLYDEYGVKR